MNPPDEAAPAGAVAGLAEILLALGEELRKANIQIGERKAYWDKKNKSKEPILFLRGAEVELAVTSSISASGGVKIWVINAGAGAEYARSGKITVHLNTGDDEFGVGMQ